LTCNRNVDQFWLFAGLTILAHNVSRLTSALLSRYQATIFVEDGTAQGRCVHIKRTRTKAAARNFAITALHNIYRRHIQSVPDKSKMLYWCELAPCPLVKWRCEPDSTIDVECAYLERNGEVTFDLAPAMRLRRGPVAHRG
jgi:hypothetical protein